MATFGQVFSITWKVLLALLIISAAIWIVVGIVGVISSSKPSVAATPMVDYRDKAADDRPSSMPLSDYEAMILTPVQAFAVVVNLPEPERTLTMLAAGTGLRISECLGLQWQDVSFDDARIFVRRTWTTGKVGAPKSRASKAPVPMHPLLASYIQDWKQQTPYSQPGDWVFASTKLRGRQPRVANMLVSDHIRPAAVRAGVLEKDDERRFGFHNLRHSLASFLVRNGTDPKTVQNLLRHSDVRTTLQLYAHSVSEDRVEAQGQFLEAMFADLQPACSAG